MKVSPSASVRQTSPNALLEDSALTVRPLRARSLPPKAMNSIVVVFYYNNTLGPTVGAHWLVWHQCNEMFVISRSKQ